MLTFKVKLLLFAVSMGWLSLLPNLCRSVCQAAKPDLTLVRNEVFLPLPQAVPQEQIPVAKPVVNPIAVNPLDKAMPKADVSKAKVFNDNVRVVGAVVTPPRRTAPAYQPVYQTSYQYRRCVGWWDRGPIRRFLSRPFRRCR